jgi:hypothetical protein
MNDVVIHTPQQEGANWLAGLREQPVWRDGLTSTLSYLIFAVRKNDERYTCVCAKAFGADCFKVKFYPDYAYWGMTVEQLKDFGAESFLDRSGEYNAGYVRFMINRRGLSAIIAHLNSARGVTAIGPEPVLKAIFSDEGKHTSRVVHQITGGGTPRTPWVLPGVNGPLQIKGPDDEDDEGGEDE